jgi:hypothetical protein
MKKNLYNKSKEEDRQQMLINQAVREFENFFNTVSELDPQHRKQASEELIALLVAKTIFTPEQINSILTAYQLLWGNNYENYHGSNDYNNTYDLSNRESILNLFSNAIDSLLTKDTILFANDVQERALVGRLAIYLRELIKNFEQEKIFLDIEYNRCYKCTKNLLEYKANYVSVDLVIHSRGNNEKNMICCEAKKKDSSQGDDLGKIKLLIKQYDYRFGIYIYELQESSIKIVFIEKDNINEDYYKEYYYSFDMQSRKFLSDKKE